MQFVFEILFQNALYHWRYVDDGKVIIRGPDVADAATAIAGATAARAAALAAVVAPTPGDIVSTVTAASLTDCGNAHINNLTAGISDDKVGPG